MIPRLSADFDKPMLVNESLWFALYQLIHALEFVLFQKALKFVL